MTIVYPTQTHTHTSVVVWSGHAPPLSRSKQSTSSNPSITEAGPHTDSHTLTQSKNPHLLNTLCHALPIHT